MEDDSTTDRPPCQKLAHETISSRKRLGGEDTVLPRAFCSAPGRPSSLGNVSHNPHSFRQSCCFIPISHLNNQESEKRARRSRRASGLGVWPSSGAFKLSGSGGGKQRERPSTRQALPKPQGPACPLSWTPSPSCVPGTVTSAKDTEALEDEQDLRSQVTENSLSEAADKTVIAKAHRAGKETAVTWAGHREFWAWGTTLRMWGLVKAPHNKGPTQMPGGGAAGTRDESAPLCTRPVRARAGLCKGGLHVGAPL